MKTVTDLHVYRLKTDGSVARDYGIFDGSNRDSEDVILKYYALDLEPGQKFLCKKVTRNIVTWGDLNETQRLEVQRNRHMSVLGHLNAAVQKERAVADRAAAQTRQQRDQQQ